jgi:hypothetical protein
MHVSTPRVPLHMRPEDDVDVILASVEIGSTSHLLALCCIASRAYVLIPVPIAAGAVRILVLRALKISHESVVRVAVTTHSVDKRSPYGFFPERTAERDLLSNHVLY